MKSKINQRGPGRPMAVITIPNKKFTFADLIEANSHVTPLTLRKFLKRDFALKGKSEVILVKDETREPKSKKGLGRKTFVYLRRAKMTAPKPALKMARKSTVSVPLASVKTTADYEATKAALLAPEPIPVPTSDITPDAIPATTDPVTA